MQNMLNKPVLYSKQRTALTAEVTMTTVQIHMHNL